MIVLSFCKIFYSSPFFFGKHKLLVLIKHTHLGRWAKYTNVTLGKVRIPRIRGRHTCFLRKWEAGEWRSYSKIHNPIYTVKVWLAMIPKSRKFSSNRVKRFWHLHVLLRIYTRVSRLVERQNLVYCFLLHICTGVQGYKGAKILDLDPLLSA